MMANVLRRKGVEVAEQEVYWKGIGGKFGGGKGKGMERKEREGRRKREEKGIKIKRHNIPSPTSHRLRLLETTRP